MKRTLSILLVALLLLFALPTVAQEGGLQAGLYATDTGMELLYLYEEGVGVLLWSDDGAPTASGVSWTKDSLLIQQNEVSFIAAEDILSFAMGETEITLSYRGVSDAYPLGDGMGTAFAGTYAAEDGRILSLSADGHGAYTNEGGEMPVIWGSLRPYLGAAQDQTDSACYLLFGGCLQALTFADGAVILSTEEGDTAFYPQQEEVAEPATVTVMSSAYDLALDLPTDRWIVEETEGGLLVTRQRDMIQYTFLSLPLEDEPTAATLDTYADHIMADCLMNVGVAYDNDDVVRDDYIREDATGRRLTTEWTKDEVQLTGDVLLWYANGRLYVALCVSDETTRPEALSVLEAALLTIQPVGEREESPEAHLPVDKEVFESIPELPVVTEQVYYRYRMANGDMNVELIPVMVATGLDPKTVSLTLRSDGTGRLQSTNEAECQDFTWVEGTLLMAEGEMSFTREGDHIVVKSQEGVIVEFAPEAEVDALIAAASAPKTEEPALPAMEELLGTWTYTRSRVLNADIPASPVDTAYSLVLNEDGSAVMLIDGSPTECEWAIREDGKISVTEADEEKYVFSYDGTVLTLLTGSDSLEMIFEKDI